MHVRECMYGYGSTLRRVHLRTVVYVGYVYLQSKSESVSTLFIQALACWHASIYRFRTFARSLCFCVFLFLGILW